MVCVLVAAAVLGFLAPVAAQAHFLGYDSVSNGALRYRDLTAYNTALSHSANAWDWHINISSVSSGGDVQVGDYGANDGRCGYYQNRSGIDYIRMNYQSSISGDVNRQKACMLHEFGHALGLQHSFSTQVMDSCPTCSTIQLSPQDHDVTDYNNLWG